MTAHEHFNMDDFVGQFQTALQVTSPKKRMFLLDWMGVSQPPRPPQNLLVVYLHPKSAQQQDLASDGLSQRRCWQASQTWTLWRICRCSSAP